MNLKQEMDEYLEKLWYMKEDNTELIDNLRDSVGEAFSPEVVDSLKKQGFVKTSGDEKKIHLTDKGEKEARQIIRSHRLAERLIHDALGGDFESGACEFEHIVAPELVDSICTMLGHPRECPHGMPIPKGECCRQFSRSAQSSVVPVTELEVGQEARVAYVNCDEDSRLHKIDGLHIRPGAHVKLHQTYPTFVIECEGANIALDREIAEDICVWKKPGYSAPKRGGRGRTKERKKRGWFRGLRFRDKEK